jgi:hypothetical protein
MAVVLQFNFSLYFQLSAPEASYCSVIAITLSYILRYRIELQHCGEMLLLVGAVIASHIYRSQLIDQHYRFN